MTLEQRVDAIAGSDGWWKSSTGETFQSAAADLAPFFSDDDIVDILSGLYYAMRDEYGD